VQGTPGDACPELALRGSVLFLRYMKPISTAQLCRPITLSGRIVRLDPMWLEHAPALAEVGMAPELWRLQPAPISSLNDMQAYVAKALDDQRKGTALPFVIVDQATAQIIGSTRYMDIAPEHRRLEIGATWLTPAHQRTGVNTEAKLLLLIHAFEGLGVQRVVFKTEALNEQSRRALLRIGAVEEGTFRKHLIAESGRARDMVYFSILDTEWPAAKAALASRLR
jgi:RimJ/RimL family protein N-acetyltransferase